jgi:membrane-associated protease RseP (regulator of RpoE activity)
MSGIEVQHEGLEWSNELVESSSSGIKIFSNPNDERLQKGFQIRFVLKSVFTIFNVREGSPAQLAGLKKGDRILSVNKSTELTIERINAFLKSGEGKPIDLVVERNGTVLPFRFILKSIL